MSRSKWRIPIWGGKSQPIDVLYRYMVKVVPTLDRELSPYYIKAKSDTQVRMNESEQHQ